jgi:transcriptional regulator with XRE-family HTH domain
MTFAEKLKELRKDSKVSQIILHLETGISNSLIQSYERGKVLPMEKNIQKLTDFFNADFDQMVRLVEKERLIRDENSRKSKADH